MFVQSRSISYKGELLILPVMSRSYHRDFSISHRTADSRSRVIDREGRSRLTPSPRHDPRRRNTSSNRREDRPEPSFRSRTPRSRHASRASPLRPRRLSLGRSRSRRSSLHRHPRRPSSPTQARSKARARSEDNWRDLLRSQAEDAYKVPSTWKKDHRQLDASTAYGFTLPRHVIPTEFSRANKTANMPTHQVPLAALLHSNLESWPLRVVANGKPVAVEVFRSRQEAVFHSLLSKRMRDHVPKLDLNELIKSAHQRLSDTVNYSGVKDLNDWSYRFKLTELVAKETAEMMVAKLPVTQSQDLLNRMQALEEENQRLKAAGGPSQAAQPSAKNQMPQPATVSQEHATLLHRFQTFERQAQEPKHLSKNLSGTSTQAIAGWIRANCGDATVKQRHTSMMTEIQDLIKKAPAGVLPDRASLLVSWGATVEQAANLNKNEVLMNKLLAACAALRE